LTSVSATPRPLCARAPEQAIDLHEQVEDAKRRAIGPLAIWPFGRCAVVSLGLRVFGLFGRAVWNTVAAATAHIIAARTVKGTSRAVDFKVSEGPDLNSDAILKMALFN